MSGVSTLHAEYKTLAPQWERCRDCIAGSDAVKSKTTKYLPMLDSHRLNLDKYKEYLMRALFYNAVGRTVQGLAGGIFQKAPSIESFTALEDTKDITLTGEPIDLFALKTTKEYLTTGRYGILIDMSGELATKPRPYWCGYRSEDILNWRFERMGGDQELCFVVLREIVDEPDPKDEFTINQITQFRVLRLTNGIYTQQLYKEIPKENVSTISSGTDGDPLKNINSNRKLEVEPQEVVTPLRRGIPLNFIPFSLPWGMIAPPLIDLVDVNLSHYRGSAQLKHGLHYVALPTPWVSGQVSNTNKPLAIGSGTAWVLGKDGQAGMLEFTGKGLGAIRQDLQDMQNMMATLGARLLEPPPRYAETALSVSMRHSSDYATLRTLAQIVEQQLTWALKVHTWWLGSEELVANMPANVELNKVFYDQSMTADELRALLLALQSASISYETFYARLSNTGWMREGVSPDEEKKAITADGDQFKKIVPNPNTNLPSEKLGDVVPPQKPVGGGSKNSKK
jgi:hypothetical protein